MNATEKILILKKRPNKNINKQFLHILSSDRIEQRRTKMCQKYPTQTKEEQMYEELMQEVNA